MIVWVRGHKGPDDRGLPTKEVNMNDIIDIAGLKRLSLAELRRLEAALCIRAARHPGQRAALPHSCRSYARPRGDYLTAVAWLAAGLLA